MLQGQGRSVGDESFDGVQVKRHRGRSQVFGPEQTGRVDEIYLPGV